MTGQKQTRERDQEHTLIWKCVLEDLRAKHPLEGDPMKWKENQIRDFLGTLKSEIVLQLVNSKEQAKEMGIDPITRKNIEHYGSLSVDTFRNNFHKQEGNPSNHTLNKFAIYLGYFSGREYISRRVSTIPMINLEAILDEKAKLENNSQFQSEKSTTNNKSKSSTRKVVWTAIGAVTLITLGFWMTLDINSNTEKLSKSSFVFKNDSSLNILILPFKGLAKIEGQQYDFQAIVHSRIQEIFIEENEHMSNLNVQRFDTTSTFFSLQEAFDIGNRVHADLVIWGTFEEYKESGQKAVTFQYLAVDKFYTNSSNIKKWKKITSKNPILSALRHDKWRGSLDALVYSCLGVIYLNEGDIPNAYRYYAKMELGSKDNWASWHSIMGYLHYRMGDIEKAYLETKKSVEIDDSQPYPFNNLGTFCRRLGKYDEAEFYLNKAIELEPNYAHAIMNLGNVKNGLKEYDTAIELYNRTLELDPTDSIAIYNRGETFFTINQPDNAEKDMLKYLTTSPNDYDAHLILSKIYKSRSELEKAKHSLKKVLEFNPGNEEAIKLLAEID